jgi:hypothetical protein
MQQLFKLFVVGAVLTTVQAQVNEPKLTRWQRFVKQELPSLLDDAYAGVDEQCALYTQAYQNAKPAERKRLIVDLLSIEKSLTLHAAGVPERTRGFFDKAERFVKSVQADFNLTSQGSNHINSFFQGIVDEAELVKGVVKIRHHSCTKENCGFEAASYARKVYRYALEKIRVMLDEFKGCKI